MHNENVWILSNRGSKTLTHILIRIYFSQEFMSDIKIYDEIDTIEDLKAFEFKDEGQIIYYAFENIEMAEYAKSRCKQLDLKYFDMYGVVFHFISGIFSKISKGGNIKSILRNCMEINPIEFALSNDDGTNPKSIFESDVVILGISRTSKTPLSIYMSNLGYKVTNIPLVPEIDIPEELFKIDAQKIFTLVVDPDRLVEIRKERIKSLGIPMDSGYATKERVCQEIEYTKSIVEKLNCKVIDVTHISIEETSEKIKNYLDSKEEF